MTARVIDGRAAAAALRERVARRVERLARPPGLAVVLVGDDGPSAIYVRNKGIACRAAGMLGFEFRLPADTTQETLLARVTALNADPAVDGILVQLPLPAHIDAARVIAAIDPDKDVDGFHPVNAGRLVSGLTGFVPCTPRGCMMLITGERPDLRGARAVVLGRSNIVGKPMAQLLLAADATVTIAHSRTRDTAALCRDADVLVAAVGIPQLVQPDWVKPGAVVIDVGINRVDGRLIGDVAPEVAEVAGALTPVPGGVGPMTIACLLDNTVTSAERRQH